MEGLTWGVLISVVTLVVLVGVWLVEMSFLTRLGISVFFALQMGGGLARIVGSEEER